jgi:hypothetical protein
MKAIPFIGDPTDLCGEWLEMSNLCALLPCADTAAYWWIV